MVDNDPQGGAREQVEAYPAEWVRYVHEPEPGIAAARNRALDRIRRDRRQAEKLVLLERELAATEVAPMQLGTEGGLEDDRLRLIFTCCHPALPLDARVALTLRTLGGLTTPEIARASSAESKSPPRKRIRVASTLPYASR